MDKNTRKTMDNENWEDWEERPDDEEKPKLFSCHLETLGQTITLTVEKATFGAPAYVYSLVAMGRVLEARDHPTLVGAVLAGVEMAFAEFNAFKLLSIDE